MAKTVIADITCRSLARVKGGLDPAAAWLETLVARYPGKQQLANRVKHSCPKWAFCVLCHKGYVIGVSAGCCPDSDGSSSANFALKAYELLRTDPSLAFDSKKLKQQVFGTKGEVGFRTPREEVEVLLALWETNSLKR